MSSFFICGSGEPRLRGLAHRGSCSRNKNLQHIKSWANLTKTFCTYKPCCFLRGKLRLVISMVTDHYEASLGISESLWILAKWDTRPGAFPCVYVWSISRHTGARALSFRPRCSENTETNRSSAYLAASSMPPQDYRSLSVAQPSTRHVSAKGTHGSQGTITCSRLPIPSEADCAKRSVLCIWNRSGNIVPA